LSEYRFELASLGAEEMASTSRLLRLVFPNGRHLTPDYLAWMYAANPHGMAVACNAYSGEELVGHMAAVPMQARVEGQVTTGMITQNGAIHPRHRGRKLQSGISAAMFEEGVRRGYSFALGVGNKYSTGPLLTRFQMVRPLEARLGVGPLRRRDGAATASVERVWDPAAVRWRLANPGQRYSVRGGSILAPTGWPGISAILHDRVELPDEGPRPAGPLRLYLGLDGAIDFGRSRYAAIPNRLRPSPLNLVWRNLAGGQWLPDPNRFVFHGADLDAY
jgi:hypothetical protein